MEKDIRDSLTILEQADFVRKRANEIKAKRKMPIGKAYEIAIKELFRRD